MGLAATEYQQVLESTTDAVLKGQTGEGRKGDVIKVVIMSPIAFEPGAITIKDGVAGVPMTLWVGIAGAVVATMKSTTPMVIRFGDEGIKARVGPWFITVGQEIRALVIMHAKGEVD